MRGLSCKFCRNDASDGFAIGVQTDDVTSCALFKCENGPTFGQVRGERLESAKVARFARILSAIVCHENEEPKVVPVWNANLSRSSQVGGERLS